jgi:hypothetical protein
LARRTLSKHYRVVRFDPNVAQYSMLKHKKEKPSPDRIQYLNSGHLRYDTDGFNSLVFREIEVKANKLYTNVKVEV